MIRLCDLTEVFVFAEASSKHNTFFNFVLAGCRLCLATTQPQQNKNEIAHQLSSNLMELLYPLSNVVQQRLHYYTDNHLVNHLCYVYLELSASFMSFLQLTRMSRSKKRINSNNNPIYGRRDELAEAYAN